MASKPEPPKPVLPRVDRPAVALGGAVTWASVNRALDIEFCPGDRELLVLDDNRWLRRFDADTGTQLQASYLGGPVPGLDVLDCRADGVALVADPGKSPILVDAKGAITRPPASITSTEMRFADDGSVLALGDAGVLRWRDDKVEQAYTAHPQALYQALGDHGTYFEIVFDAKPARENGLWMMRDGARVALPQRPGELMQVSVAPDGAVAIADEMNAYGWVVANKRPGARQLLMDQSGYHIKAVAATTKRFIVMGADGDVWFAKRPAMSWDYIGSPCGDEEFPLTMTVSHDETRVAVACTNIGIRIFDFERKRRVDKLGLTTSGGNLIAWSAVGDRLAVRDARGIQIWHGPHLVAKIVAGEGRSLWWSSASEISGTRGGLETWTFAAGQTTTKSTRTRIAADVAAHSAHGETLVARRYQKDKVAIVRGESETAIALPESKLTWVSGAAIDAGGTRGLVWRGKSAAQPATEILEIDVGAATAKLREVTATAVALAASGYIYATPAGELVWQSGDATKPLARLDAEIVALAIAGDLIAAGARDGSITILTMQGQVVGKRADHTATIKSLAFSPDGKRLASIGADSARVWDLGP